LPLDSLIARTVSPVADITPVADIIPVADVIPAAPVTNAVVPTNPQPGMVVSRPRVKRVFTRKPTIQQMVPVEGDEEDEAAVATASSRVLVVPKTDANDDESDALAQFIRTSNRSLTVSASVPIRHTKTKRKVLGMAVVEESEV
jgi:hypothetical protein